MKYKCQAIIVVLLVVLALGVAGCTSSGNSGTSSTPIPAGATATPVTSPAPTSGSPKLVDLTNVHYYEYQTTQGNATSTVRWDFNVNYNGQAADKITMTSNNPQTGISSSQVEFVDHATHKQILGGNMTAMKNGQVTYQTNIPASSAPPLVMDFTNTTGNAPVLTNAGSETVTVPAGTFTATKYTFTDVNGNPGTYWIAPNVPLFIKMEGVSDTNPPSTIDIELMKWG